LKKMSKKRTYSAFLFEAEVELLRMISHPHVMKFEKIYADSLNYYIVTKLYTGGDLLTHIKAQYGRKNGRQFTETYVAKLLNQIINAVEFLHDNDIVHRDIKPENIVLESRSSEAKLVLIDFGCAKKVEEGHVYSDLVGTPFFIAPEYLMQPSRNADELKAADVWSIGVICYVLCTGRPPFQGATNEDIFIKIIGKQLKFPKKAKLSLNAKNFMKTTLHKGYRLRPRASELRNHQWLTGGASDVALSSVSSLVSFQFKVRLNVVINRVLTSEPDALWLHRKFEDIDVNSDGHISLQELVNFMLKLGYAKCVVRETAKKIWRKVDKDENGEIDIDEFTVAWSGLQLSKDERLVSVLFNYFDRDGNGHIDLDEMKQVFGDIDVTETFDHLDEDHSGGITLDEFGKALKKLNIIEDNDYNLQQLFTMVKEDDKQRHSILEPTFSHGAINNVKVAAEVMTDQQGKNLPIVC